MNPLKIIKLEANNVKRLKAVEITPVGHTVTISGKNDQGKTSILDSIEYALAGNRTICEKPVRLGEAKARIVCDLGDTVLSPFAGIGSEGHEAIKMGRRFVGIELKESYFKQAYLNLEAAEKSQAELSLVKPEGDA